MKQTIYLGQQKGESRKHGTNEVKSQSEQNRPCTDIM